MKIFRHRHGEQITLTSGGKPSTHLPAEFIEMDAFDEILGRVGCLDQYDVSPAEMRHSAGQDLTSKTVLVMRRGGYGDLLWITQIIRKLKERYPTAKFNIACNPRHHMVYDGNMDIRDRIPYPIPLAAFESADYHLSFEGCIEPDRTGRSVYQLFADRAGISLSLDECVPIYRIPPGPDQMIRKWIKQNHIGHGKRVMIHMGASTPWKSWYPLYIFQVAYALGNAGVTVFLAGNKNVMHYRIPEIPNVYQVCYNTRNGQRIDYFTMEETLALMSRCDLFIGPDSGLIHFSAALGVPAIGIYGAFPASSYVSTYPLVTAIENRAACPKSPCFPHLNNRCTEMDKDGYSECLKGIEAERVIIEIERKLGVEIKTEIPGVQCRRVAA